MEGHDFLNAIADFLTETDWHIEKVGENLIATGFAGRDANFRLVIRLFPEWDQIDIVCLYPVRIPEPKRKEICDLIVRINYGFPIGKVDMDPDDGSIMFRVYLLVDGPALNKQQFKNALYWLIDSSDKWYPAFMAVVYGGCSPEEAWTVHGSTGEGVQH